MRRMVFIGLVSMMALAWARGYALDKVRWGSAVKLSFKYYLPVMAAEEKGFSRQNGVQLEFIPFAGGNVMNAAMAAGHIDVGQAMAGSLLQGAAAGLPATMIAAIIPKDEMFFWVKADSPYRTIKDLKGTRIGVHMLRTGSHAMGIMVVKAEGLEKDVKWVGTGGREAVLAGVKTGAIAAAAGYSFTGFGKPFMAGQVRPLVKISDYLPKDWIDHVLYGRRDFLASHPETAKRTVKAILQGINFVWENPKWALEKMQALEGLSDKEAKYSMDYSGKFTRDGRISREAVENTRAFHVNYGIVSQEKVPPADELFTTRFIP